MSKASKWSREPKVVIKPSAYLTMLKHVLVYSNQFLVKSVEVMGICYGKEEDDVLVQYASVPISHGTALEVEFADNDYAAFAHADEKMGEKGWYAIGWYHSHPGLTPFFSKIDIKNQLFYQKEQSPFAYGLVFDHALMELDQKELALGFQGFRLDDYTLGMATDYHEIVTEVEMPAQLAFYAEIDEIVNTIEFKKPIIQEERELMNYGKEFHQNDLDFDAVFHQANKDSIEKDIGELLPEGLSSSEFSSLKSILTDLSLRLLNYNQGIRGPIAQLSEVISQMEEAVGPGASRIQNTLEQDIIELKQKWMKNEGEGSQGLLVTPETIKSSVSRLTESNSKIKELLDKLNRAI